MQFILGTMNTRFIPINNYLGTMEHGSIQITNKNLTKSRVKLSNSHQISSVPIMLKQVSESRS